MFKHVKFTKEEFIALFFTVIVSAFILSFGDWGKNKFDFNTGLQNLAITFIVVAVSLLIKLLVQKYAAAKKGYEVKFKPWYIGFLFGVILVFLTNGVLVFLAFGGLMFYLSERTRLGQKEHDLSYSEMGWISILGPLANVVIALIAKGLLSGGLFDTYVLMKFIYVNLWFAFYAMIPIPFVYKFDYRRSKKFSEFGTSEGLKLLYASPFEYFIILILIFINIFSIIVLPVNYSVYITLFFILVSWLVYIIFYRQNITKRGDKYYKYRID